MKIVTHVENKHWKITRPIVWYFTFENNPIVDHK